MYEWLGICLALSALLTLNALASLVTAMLWRLMQLRAQQWSASTRAQWLFALRVLPGLAATICVVVLLIPAYVTHEPRHKAEVVTLKLAALAVISAAGLLLAIWRGLAAWLVTRRLVKNWLLNSELMLHGSTSKVIPSSIKTYRLRHSFPVIAVVGIFRPKLFIAEHLFDSLTSDELIAAIAHECGHLSARDNLKRNVLRLCRDVLTIVPCGRALDREWAEAAEAAADEFAAKTGNASPLDLASALVKIARLVPTGLRPAIPTGALLIGENAGGITGRVTRLTQLASRQTATNLTVTVPAAIPASLSLLFATLLVAVTFTANSSLATIHHWLEIVVSALR